MWGRGLGRYMEAEAELHESLAQMDNIHEGVSVKMFSDTAVSLLLSYKVEDETILRSAATGLVAKASSCLGPYKKLFTYPSLLSPKFWDHHSLSLSSQLYKVTQLEEPAMAALQAMLLLSTMLLTGHKPAGLALQVSQLSCLSSRN